MKRIIALIGISLLLISFTAEIDEWEVWDAIGESKEGHSYISAINSRMLINDESLEWTIAENSYYILPALKETSLTERKKFYRLFIAKGLNPSKRMSPLSSNSRLLIELLKSDFTHVYKYLERVNTPQLQFVLNSFILDVNNLLHDDRSKSLFPKELLKLKNLDRRVYLIARAEFNKIKSNHRVQYKHHEKYRKMKRNMQKK